MVTTAESQTSLWLMKVLSKSEPIHTQNVPYDRFGITELIFVEELLFEIKVPKFGSIAKNIDYLTPDDLPLCSDVFNYKGKYYMVKKISRNKTGILHNQYLVIAREAGY